VRPVHPCGRGPAAVDDAPTVVRRDGIAELVGGSAGSNRIRSALLQVAALRATGDRVSVFGAPNLTDNLDRPVVAEGERGTGHRGDSGEGFRRAFDRFDLQKSQQRSGTCP
jgi:hypothetical protein